MDAHILVVDDEKTITDLVGIYLKNEGYQVTLAYTGADAAREILTNEFDLAVLDIMLPDVDGFELLRTIRNNHTYPVIMLTARDSQTDKIEGLSLGADDYVVKPFRPLELVARVKAQLRRYTKYGSRGQAEEEASEIGFNGLVINRDSRSVMVDEKPVRLTPLEYSILLYLAENRGRVVPVADLFQAVWGEEFMSSSNNTVMVHIRHLREKIGDNAQSRVSLRISGASAIPSRRRKTAGKRLYSKQSCVVLHQGLHQILQRRIARCIQILQRSVARFTIILQRSVARLDVS